MGNSPQETRPVKSWLLALAAVVVCGPWPDWDTSLFGVVFLCAGLLALARPRGNDRLPWLAVAVAAVAALLPTSGAFDVQRATGELDRHCSGMLATGESLATDGDLIRLLSAAGEAVEPTLPFDTLERAARGVHSRTIYLVDDRGRIIAWGGAGNAFPVSTRLFKPETM